MQKSMLITVTLHGEPFCLVSADSDRDAINIAAMTIRLSASDDEQRVSPRNLTAEEKAGLSTREPTDEERERWTAWEDSFGPGSELGPAMMMLPGRPPR